MPKVYLLAFVACFGAACATNRVPVLSEHAPRPDVRTVLHVLNRTGFGPRPSDIERVQNMGLRAYLDEQLHPELIPDGDLQPRLAPLMALNMSARAFATDYYMPMVAARQEFTNTQKISSGPSKLPY